MHFFPQLIRNVHLNLYQEKKTCIFLIYFLYLAVICMNEIEYFQVSWKETFPQSVPSMAYGIYSAWSASPDYITS